MALRNRLLVDTLGRIPFLESTGLTPSVGELHTTVHRHLVDLLANGIVEVLVALVVGR